MSRRKNAAMKEGSLLLLLRIKRRRGNHLWHEILGDVDGKVKRAILRYKPFL